MCRCWWMLMLLAGAAAHAASFDCAKAKTPQEKAICASPKLSNADDQMAAAYRSALAAAPPEMREKLRESQRDWIRNMAATCRPGNANLPGRMNLPAAFPDCLFAYETNRKRLLQHTMQRIGGVTFVWRSVNLSTPDITSGGTGDDQGTLSAKWPEAMAHTPAWKAWNRAIETAAIQNAAVSSGPPPNTWKGALTAAIDIDENVTIESVGAQLVTADVETYWDGHGAAHGNFNEIQFNWMLRGQRELRSDDVFRSDSRWAHVVESICDSDLRKQLGDEYANNPPPGTIPNVLKKVVLSSENWKLGPKGLTVAFPQYSVACYACAPSPVTIPWPVLEPYLNPSFETPH